MKKLFVLVIIASANIVNAQWDKFGGLVYMKWGYQGGKSSIDKYFFESDATASGTGSTEMPHLLSSKGLDYKNKALFCEVEAIKKNMIFGCRFGLGLKKQQPGGVYTRESTGFNTYLGFGFAIKDRISFIPTARYNWYLFRTESVSQYPDGMTQNFPMIGGHQRGFGLNAMIPMGKHFLLRAGYYYEWIFRESKKYKGLAKTPELELYIPLDDDHIFGFAFKVALPVRTMYEKWEVDNPGFYQPETTIKSTLFEASFSLPLTGSTTSQIVTITVVE